MKNFPVITRYVKVATVSIIMLVTVFSVQSQTFEEFKKQEQARVEGFVKKQEEEKARIQKELLDYINKQDQEWENFLLEEWKNFNVFKGEEVPKDKEPKPTRKPVFEPTSIKNSSSTDAVDVKTLDLPSYNAVKVIPQPFGALCKPKVTETGTGRVSVNYFGKKLIIAYDPSLKNCRIQVVNQKNISGFWKTVSGLNYTPTIDRLLKVKSEMNLNDWGYVLLVEDFFNAIYKDDLLSSRLMIWHALIRSGYGIRLAYNQSNISLLIPALQNVYGTKYLKMDGVKYLIYPEIKNSNVFAYESNYPSAGRFVDFNISSPINFNGNKYNKTVSFNYDDKDYQLKLCYDPDLIAFLKQYPIVDLGVHYNSTASFQLKESLINELKPLVIEMDELTAVNFLLRFVQTAFAYKTDHEQFGKEKYFFAEEVLFYPYCDCEDRTVFFTYLVREILGLRVIGLDYPGHESSAVCFTSPQMGNSFTYKNKKYTIADPTYINAPVGLTMPEYAYKTPTVCDIDCKDADVILLNNIWDKVQRTGLYKGSNSKNSKIMPNGQILLTGYFSGNTLKSPAGESYGNENSNKGFVAMLDNNMKFKWANVISSTKNAVGMSLETTNSGNVIVAGSYSGTVKVGDLNLKSNESNSDLFVACFSEQGSPLWINNAGIESLPRNEPMNFSASFNIKGSKLSTTYSEQHIQEKNRGLYINDDGKIYYNGVTNDVSSITGSDMVKSYASKASVNLAEILGVESKKLISQQKTDKAIAGLLAAIRIVKYMGMSLTGVETQKALDINNPEFKKVCPNIYKNLGNINFVKNNEGIITIQTIKGSDIYFDKVRITNNSTISISELSEGNFKVDVLSGIKVGKMVIWYNLNYIKLFNDNGNLLFDYDTDHTQVTVNVKDDILD